ncbi:hypothetical protein HPB52_025514 [Rhipicephalus sanguineus]|uniref:Uncharacterized protein n=1 Tax=Rhipicephalus sanguineus TaxID=34632 RepID=A0A9D4P8W8_RHISA|nr:hypothetical protein HPB52_025514 [Rhipicephalus sanguineus]
MAHSTWLEKAKEEKVQPGSKTRSHLVRLSLEPGFPSSRVAQAYLEPTVDESRETFSWGTPDLDALRTYPFKSCISVKPCVQGMRSCRYQHNAV